MRALTTVALAGCLLLAACQEDRDNAGPSAKAVSVAVTREAILDDTYLAADTATVHNATFEGAVYGVVTLRARRGRGESEESPVLSASVHTSTGGSITCQMPRSIVWSSSNELIRLDLRCNRQLDLAAVTGVTLPN